MIEGDNDFEYMFKFLRMGNKDAGPELVTSQVHLVYLNGTAVLIGFTAGQD